MQFMSSCFAKFLKILFFLTFTLLNFEFTDGAGHDGDIVIVLKSAGHHRCGNKCDNHGVEGVDNNDHDYGISKEVSAAADF